MRLIRLVAVTMFIAAFAALPAFGQQRQGTNPPATSATPGQAVGATVAAKIAFVDTGAFRHEKLGILRWIAAASKVKLEFATKERELADLETRIQAITKDLDTLGNSPVVDRKSILAKQEEVARLQREQKFKKEEGEAQYKRRYEEVVGPVSADIVRALEAFTKQRGITLLLEAGRLVELGTIVFADPSSDLTAAFIADYNSKNPVTATTAAPAR